MKMNLPNRRKTAAEDRKKQSRWRWASHAQKLLLFIITLTLITGCETIPTSSITPKPWKNEQQATEQYPHLTEDKPPAHIALLLPFDGVFADAGNAVRNGFLSAWFKDAKGAKRPRITIHNTMGANVQLVYKEAISAGAEFVIGPLDKPSVALLEELPQFPVPTLTLNNGKEASMQNNRNTVETLILTRIPAQNSPPPQIGATKAPLYQFTLSPEFEAGQAAQRARYDGHARAAILTPQTPWGQRMEHAFATAWEQLGGIIVDSRSFPAELKEISATVERLLKTDTDCILMAAFPREARQLQPQIKFHHMGNRPMPVYTTYHVFSGVVNPLLDEDINGIIFADMPWVLEQHSGNQSSLRNLVTSTWPESTSKYSRFYAFGIDAYRIIPYLPGLRFRNSPNFKGETGELSVDSQGHVNKQSLWAVMQRGKPVPDKNGPQYEQHKKSIERDG
uniref:LppC putative lipoprotein n=1 Tax=Candidatus Kentrum sp. SD TaxID=2126332 RepID=A0A450Y5P2_9GAMM|nr:MAG: LppC putative lipoprotein [Candidatus Kentron sp. SD]VFK40669.1 MAG: LppC putative lipoprotein [Candidatus Kentron sp. SD]